MLNRGHALETTTQRYTCRPRDVLPMIVGYHSNAFPRTVASTLLDAVQMYWVRAVKMFRKMLLMLKCFTPVQMCSIKIAIKKFVPENGNVT